MRFTKGHGTGNDFVVVPDEDNTDGLSAESVAALCDRRTGIGADGVLRVVRTAADPQLAGYVAPSTAEWFMDYRNADGSVAEMCGNGVRVFARYLVAGGLVAPGHLVVGTRSGPVPVEVTGQVVRVHLPPPRILGEAVAQLAGVALPGTVVDCGNPHLVCPVSSAAQLAALELTTPPVVDDAAFPHGVNVEPATVPAADRARMRVYERGVGETLSCGSGAVAVAAVVRHRAGRGQGEVTVQVPGGVLTVVSSAHEAVLSGPAVLVAHGRVSSTALLDTRPGDQEGPAGNAHPGQGGELPGSPSEGGGPDSP